MVPQAEKAAIEALAARFALVALPGGAVEGMWRFLELLLRWNARINLTGARSALELIEEHLPDSFALAQVVPAEVDLVDVGSGGGLPAVPFALLRPDVRMTLVEPRAKRVAFLREAVRTVGVEAAVVPKRIEAVSGRFFVAASRATFPPSEWVARSADLLREGGFTVAFLSQGTELPAGGRGELSYQAGGKGRVLAVVPRP